MPAEQDLQTAARPQPQSRQAGHVAATCMLALLLSGSIGAHAKRLVAFGDSITDNGNGTRVYVHRWFAALLERTEPFTVGYPPPTASGGGYWESRWSNGPTWIEYLADMVDGYELHNCAVGYAVTNQSNTIFSVGDFWPDDLLSNKKGTQDVVLPTLADQVEGYLAQNLVSEEDVFVLQAGNNDLTAFGQVDFFHAFKTVELEPHNFPAYIIDYVAYSNQLALETLYRAGGRKFMVWDILAGEMLPLVGTVNWLVNIMNDVLAHAHKPAAQQDVFQTYVGRFCDVTNAALAVVRRNFAASHPDALIIGIPAAELQRRYAANYAALGFVDVTHGCSSILTIGNYKTGDEYTRADTTATFPAAAATLAFTPLLVRKLDDWTADLLGLNGLDKIPASVQDCLNKLVAISTDVLNKGDTIGHYLGFIFSSKPLFKGGFSPYTDIATCQHQSGDHFYHDEVHPTTRQHHLLAKDVMAIAGHLFQ